MTEALPMFAVDRWLASAPASPTAGDLIVLDAAQDADHVALDPLLRDPAFKARPDWPGALRVAQRALAQPVGAGDDEGIRVALAAYAALRNNPARDDNDIAVAADGLAYALACFLRVEGE
jgi:hypothetical protein